MRERGDGSVNLDNQSPDAVRFFLDFAYSGEMLITDGNVDMLFQIASFLQVSVRPSLEIWQYLLIYDLFQLLLIVLFLCGNLQILRFLSCLKRAVTSSSEPWISATACLSSPSLRPTVQPPSSRVPKGS